MRLAPIANDGPDVSRTLLSWGLTAIAAITLAIALNGASSSAQTSALVFVGGPLLAFAGVFPATFEFMHASRRIVWLPLPVDGGVHWSDGSTHAFIRSVGFLVIVSASVFIGTHAMPLDQRQGYAASVGLYAICFALLTGLIPALYARFGALEDPKSQVGQLQRSLSGGLTLPQATVYLYAPALVVALASAAAMVGQLLVERVAVGQTFSPQSWALAGVGPLLALGARLYAPRVFSSHVHRSAPWLAQASRSFGGDPHHRRLRREVHAGDLWVRRALAGCQR